MKNRQDYITRDQETKYMFVKQAKEHQELDRFVQWSRLKDDHEDAYWKYRWCFYWCMMQSKNIPLLKAAQTMKLPSWIIDASVRIFDFLPAREAVLFPLELLETIPVWIDTWDMYRYWNYQLIIRLIQHTEEKKFIKECAELRLNKEVNSEHAISAITHNWNAWEKANTKSDSESSSSGWVEKRDILLSVLWDKKTSNIYISKLDRIKL